MEKNKLIYQKILIKMEICITAKQYVFFNKNIRLWLLIVVSILAFNVEAQTENFNYDPTSNSLKDTIYYNSNWESVVKSNAYYYRVITKNNLGTIVGKVYDYFVTGELQCEMDSAIYINIQDDNKSIFVGHSKGYYRSGRKNFDNEYDMNGNVISSIHYHENGMKKSEYGKCLDSQCYYYYTEEGKLFRIDSIMLGLNAILFLNDEEKPAKYYPIIDSKIDSFNIIEYSYSGGNLIGYFKGFNRNEYWFGEMYMFPNKSDTTIHYFYGNKMNIDCLWRLKLLHSEAKPPFSDFFESFDEINSSWSLQSDENASVKIVNGKLQVKFFETGFFRRSALISPPPLSFENNEFSIEYTVEKGETTSSGVEFLMSDRNNFNRFTILPAYKRALFERMVNGIRDFHKIIEIDEVFFSKRDSNYVKLVKFGKELKVFLNGHYISNLDEHMYMGETLTLVTQATSKFDMVEFDNVKINVGKQQQVGFEKFYNSVKVKSFGGVYSVPVELNGVLKIDFIFDSGASDVNISPDVALTLIKTGTITEKDWLPGAYYQFADGSVSKSERFILRSVKIGDKIVYNVTCSISNSINAPMLLGQSFLMKFGQYTFDNKKLELILE